MKRAVAGAVGIKHLDALTRERDIGHATREFGEAWPATTWTR